MEAFASGEPLRCAYEVCELKAKEWLDRGHEAEDPIDVINNLWFAFNNLFYQQTGSRYYLGWKAHP